MKNKLRPYYTLLSLNSNFRNLWLSQVVSNFGDWFGVLAIYDLVLRYSQSEFLLGLIIVVKMLSFALFSPWAGFIVDKFDRRKLMIFTDIARAIVVLGFLLARSEDVLWLVYVLTALQMMISAIFEPSKTSIIPTIVTKEELVTANIISSATWSLIFSLGMGIGGLATAFLGTDAVFIFDSLSYVISAIFISNMVVEKEPKSLSTTKAWSGIVDGFKYLSGNGLVLRPALAKGVFALFLGGLVYSLVIIADSRLMMGSLGIGLLYAARGVGTAVGPVIARRVFPDSKSWIFSIGIFMVLSGISYSLLSFGLSIELMLVAVFLSHCASGGSWVFSTVLLQERVPNTFRGRVFSSEWMLFTIGTSVSTFFSSLLLEYKWVSVEQLIAGLSLGLVLSGVIWRLTASRNEKKDQLVFSLSQE